ncbi:MAG: DsrE family protein [Thermoplasmatota archaeon]
MGRKVALFAFNGETMCFVHVLINAIDMVERNYDVKLIIEGAACRQVKELSDPEKPFSNIYRKVVELGILDCVCKACSNKMGSLDSALEQNLNICGELGGHPSIARYMEDGYEVLTF